MLLLITASSGVVSCESISGTTATISATPNPSGYISAPHGSYITESDKNTAENIGNTVKAAGTVADVVTSVATDDYCKAGATLGATVAASGTTFSVGSLTIPAGAAGLAIGIVSCAPAVLSALFDPAPGYQDMGDVAKNAYISTHTQTYPETSNSKPYKADAKKAWQEWQTASWIGANGGSGEACTSDADPGTSSSGSDLPCI
jgi:hypothetical protein